MYFSDNLKLNADEVYCLVDHKTVTNHLLQSVQV